MAAQDLIEVKFRLSDGTDIGPSKYSPAVSVASLKEKILAQWPKGWFFFSIEISCFVILLQSPLITALFLDILLRFFAFCI